MVKVDAWDRLVLAYRRADTTAAAERSSRGMLPGQTRSEIVRSAETGAAALVAVLEDYTRSWQPGQNVPPGWMVCDGVPWYQGAAEGLHLRPLSVRGSGIEEAGGLIPRTRDGEEMVESFGSATPDIILCRRKDAREEAQSPQIPRRYRSF